MQFLLDTHALLWWLASSERLSDSARRAIADDRNGILISAATAWEIATKHRLGRLPEAAALTLDFSGNIADQGFEGLEVTVEDGLRAGGLPGPHRDPFDRMLIAQATRRGLVLVSNESLFDGVRRLW